MALVTRLLEEQLAAAKAGDAGKASEQASRALSSGALERAVKDGESSEKALREMAAPWSPWRAVAARLLWSYYRAVKEREGIR